jgi:hypothetical protein
MQSVTNIVQLRQLLAERFPNVRMRLGGTGKSTACWASGIAQLDTLLDGGLPKSALTELVSPRLSTGSGLVVQTLLRAAAGRRQWAALVDGQDCFDPTAFENAELNRLLWVRCQNAVQALKAADFLLRDGNVSLVILDLQINPAKQLQKVPASSWYRLQRCLEPRATAFLVVTPRAMVGAAHLRLRLQNRFDLGALAQARRELIGQLEFELVRMHGMEHESRELAKAG